MSASGQMPSDYGQHWMPEAVWAEYGACRCGAEAGNPCLDMRVKHAPRKPTWQAHPGRMPAGVLPPSKYPRLPVLDFPTAWRMARRGLVHKTWRCSYVQHQGGSLCDCGAVEEEFKRIYDRRRT